MKHRKRIVLTKTILLSLFCNISLFTPLFSQENYLPGFVIKVDQDTLRGYIGYRDWGKNPEKINFKKNIDSEPIPFTPSDILEFNVQNNIYTSAIIDTEVSSLKTSELKYSNKLKIKIDTAFLQTFFRGEKSFYYYKNNLGRINFYTKTGSEFELLLYKKHLISKEGYDGIQENKAYLNQLASYFGNCNSIISRLKETEYKLNDLIKLYQSYYDNCSSTDSYFRKKEEKISIEAGLLAGASITSLKFTSSNFDYLTNVSYNQSINFSTGVFLDLIMPRNDGKWSVYNELLLSSYNFDGVYEDIESEDVYSITSTQISFSYMKLNNLLRYKQPIGASFLFFNVGISNGLILSFNNNKTVESQFYSTNRVDQDLILDFEQMSRFEQSLIVGLGTKYKKFSLEIRGERGNGMSKIPSLKSTTIRSYILFGYTF